jgi:hypothetical protein
MSNQYYSISENLTTEGVFRFSCLLSAMQKEKLSSEIAEIYDFFAISRMLEKQCKSKICCFSALRNQIQAAKIHFFLIDAMPF